MTILLPPGIKGLKYTEKDDTAIRKHCHNHGHTADYTYLKMTHNSV